MNTNDSRNSGIKNTIRDPRAVPVRRALISVTNKHGLDKFVQKLQALGVEILSTGGTAKMLKDAGIDVIDVAAYTGFPEIMDGRVKTLHPKVHGGILARRNEDSHLKAMADHNIDGIDLVVVNLYPFTEVMREGSDYATCIENVDIGGPAMIRAAAKNHEFVAVVTDPQDYEKVINNLEDHDGATTYALRQTLAATALALTATYDSNIASWIAAQIDEYDFPRRISFSGNWKQTLRYGENPHQKAALYLDGSLRPGVTTAKQLQGKELSYNNLNDTDAAFELVSEFDEPAVAIIKHANPSGVSCAASTLEAYKKALLCDPVSAFGGIIALNRPLDKETAEAIIKVFSEVIIAPSINADALTILQQKEKLRVLTTGGLPDPKAHRRLVKSLSGGLLVQDADNGQITPEDLKIVSEREPTQQEMKDMIFAFRVAKHVKSNAIVYARNNATVGIGAGQMSRIDSTRIAAQKAKDAAISAGLDAPLTKGSVVASDAFFPFADGLIAAADAGATAVIQPGGSIRDEDVIAAADERGLAMVFTDMRHFRH
ncbi:MAG: bifunctional phosphoribosylaminoimidazolecarboxamide formyltransferase/inosine monophosphate cyclohydrolase [Alphaproteobacteria bacterium CG_4_9_14_3_um_filter_47_13]|nr:MAG: bifunctional phosphoribosylaminoimidazolecarboxamide formyltransferase/inosine monophosphate cyclohydrolase [Alphaproteobacteria bacterium CG_4_9_14_3_um_filter_47_13]